MRNRLAAGFRVKSGKAILVLVLHDGDLAVVERRVVELSDPKTPDTIQPYHVLEEMPEREGRKEIDRLVRIVERAAGKSVGALVAELRKAGTVPVCAGLVVGSTVDPATIGSTHIRAHAEEGKLFRTVLEEALNNENIPTFVIRERDCYAEAAKLLKRTAEAVRKTVDGIGGSVRPWRADEKTACVAAWMALEKSGVTRVSGRQQDRGMRRGERENRKPQER